MKRAPNLIVFGATSAIAERVVRIYAERGSRLFLTGRNAEKLNVIAADARARAPQDLADKPDSIVTAKAELADTAAHPHLLANAVAALGYVDAVLIAHGELGEQKRCDADWTEAERLLQVNFLSAASLSLLAANHFERQNAGTLAVISSVAGERCRKNNCVYGAAKAGLTAFLSGLRSRLAATNVKVITIKPGFVDTPMTRNMQKGALFATPERVARDIVRAMDRGKEVIYTPWFWRWIMFAIRAIPERLFKRMGI